MNRIRVNLSKYISVQSDSRLSRDGTKKFKSSIMLAQKSTLAKFSYVRASYGPAIANGYVGRINGSCTTPEACELRKQDVPCNNGDYVRVSETLRQN